MRTVLEVVGLVLGAQVVMVAYLFALDWVFFSVLTIS